MNKTAFVFGGGGSLGAVQVGMLRELIRTGVDAQFVVGSSVGAINAAYFAGAPSSAGVEKLERIWRGLRRNDVFPVTLRAMWGLLGGHDSLIDPANLRGLIKRYLPYSNLEDAAIPVHVIATNLGGVPICLSSGPAIDAILASAAIPAAFPSVRIGNDDLVDGAVASNTPISIASQARRHPRHRLSDWICLCAPGTPEGGHRARLARHHASNRPSNGA